MALVRAHIAHQREKWVNHFKAPAVSISAHSQISSEYNRSFCKLSPVVACSGEGEASGQEEQIHLQTAAY